MLSESDVLMDNFSHGIKTFASGEEVLQDGIGSSFKCGPLCLEYMSLGGGAASVEKLKG